MNDQPINMTERMALTIQKYRSNFIEMMLGMGFSEDLARDELNSSYIVSDTTLERLFANAANIEPGSFEDNHNSIVISVRNGYPQNDMHLPALKMQYLLMWDEELKPIWDEGRIS